MTPRYAEAHGWARPTDDPAVFEIGISDFAQEQLGDIIFVELPSVGTVVKEGEAVAKLESVKTASEAIAPIAGTVLEVNAKVATAPEAINETQGAVWLYRLKAAEPSEYAALLDEAAYLKSIN